MNSLWLGAFVGFLVTVVFGWMFPIIGHLFGGLVAGLIAGGGISRGVLTGFLAGTFGGIIPTILSTISGIALSGLLGVIVVTVVILFFGFGAISATIGGLIGGAIAKYFLIR